METELDRKIAEQRIKDELKAAAEKAAAEKKALATIEAPKPTLESYNADIKAKREALLRRQREIQMQKQLESHCVCNAILHLNFWNWLDKDKFWFGLCCILMLFCAYNFVTHGVVKDYNAYKSQLSASIVSNIHAS